MTSEEIPLVCNLAAMTPAQRGLYDQHKERLRKAVTEVKELPNGYAFHFADEPGLLLSVAGFVEGERQCCVFFSFNIEVRPNDGAVSLTITGPDGTGAFINDALRL